MGEIKDEINWEAFLDNFFDVYRPTIDKQPYKEGIAINYMKDDVYIWCNLDATKSLLKKLEFGRYVTDESGNKISNWIKGVFINDEHAYITFKQTSFDSEYFDRVNNYQIIFDNVNKDIISRLLQRVFEKGWAETEYQIGKDNFYKVEVMFDGLKWSIPLMNTGEQDIPLLTDKIDIWLRMKIGDAFWNNSKRTVNTIEIPPLNK